MKVGNYDIKMPFSLGGIGGMFSSLFWGFMILLIVGIIIYWIYKGYKNKAFYVNPIDLTIYYSNGTKKTKSGMKGGKYINSSGVWDFKVKIPKQFQTKQLGYMPDFSKADSDGTLHFITSGDGTIWLQVEEKLNIAGKEQARDENGVLLFDEQNKPLMIDTYKLLLNPVRTDVKIATVNSLKNWAEMVNKNKLTVFGIALGAFLIMVIAHLISLYIQTKIKCPV
jgi:hypothetical protein